MNISFTLEQIVGICTAIAAIAGAYAIISAPIKKYNEKLNNYDTMLRNDKTRLDNLDKAVEANSKLITDMQTTLTKEIKSELGAIKELIDKTNQQNRDENIIQGNMIYEMLDHMATNNNTGNMNKLIKEYSAYYRNRKEG